MKTKFSLLKRLFQGSDNAKGFNLRKQNSPAFQRGFTLVELLVVIAVIGILVTLVIVAVDPVQVIRKSQDTRRRSDLQAMRVALQQFYNDYKYYPRNNNEGKLYCWSLSGSDGTLLSFTGTTAWSSNGSSSCTTSDTSYIKALPKNPTFTTGGYYYQVFDGPYPYQSYRLLTNLSYPSTDDTNSYTKCGAINTGTSVITVNNPSVPTVNFALCSD
ncbi:MAG: type II secretion system protein [bacterium]|nr:type II secretion system protein [bacterium]